VSLRNRYTTEAEAELDAAAGWFEANTAMGGSSFIDTIEDAVEEIRQLPAAWPVWTQYPRFRVRTLRKLRYRIFYELVDDLVLVVAISHTKRRPGYWLDRIK
jgi:toxin ParE1/3/4